MKHYSGFTLIELIISLAVGTFVLMAILATLTDFLRYHLTSRTNESLLTTSESILNDLTLEIQNTQSIEFQFTCFKLHKLKSDVEYCLEDKQIKKVDSSGDTLVITPKNVTVEQFTIADKSGVNTPEDTTPPLLEIHLKLNSKSLTVPSATVEKTTTISSRFRKYEEYLEPPKGVNSNSPNEPITNPALVASPPPNYKLN